MSRASPPERSAAACGPGFQEHRNCDFSLNCGSDRPRAVRPAIASPISCQASPRDPASPPGAAPPLTHDEERPSVLSTAPGRESTWRHLV